MSYNIVLVDSLIDDLSDGLTDLKVKMIATCPLNPK